MCSKRRNKIWYFLISICLLMSSVPVNPAWGTEQENKAVMDLPANELENAVQNADLSEPILSQEELTLLVTSNQKFSTLKENEKEQLLDEYLVSSAKMELCETAGYTTQDSIELSRIFQNIDMTPEQFEEMAENFGDREWAMEEAKAYANYRYTHASIKMGADPICIGYLISGIPAGEILKARAMAYFLDLEIQDTNTFAEPNIEYAEDDMIGQIAGLFHTKKELLEAYATANELSVDEISDIVMEEIGSVLQEAGGPMPMASGGADYAYDPETHPLAPFAYDRAGTERINEQTGSVGYVETDAVLPGKNGLDLTIGVRYDSGNSSNAIPSTVSSSFGSYNKISNYAKLKYMYSPMNSFSPGWDFTNSYIRYYINGFRNIYSAIVPPAGMTRSIALKDVENKNKTEISLDNGRIKIYDMRLYKDSSYEDNGVTSMFCAKYMDGRKEYFDDQGKLMKTENRFGDQILYRYSATGTEIADFQQNYNKVEITDTRGQITTIEKKAVETHQDAEGKDIHTQAMVITFPDQSTVTYNLRNTLHPYPNKEITQVVDSKTNQEGMTTYFEYIEDDRSKFNFMGAFATYGDHTFYPMTKIVHPTGLVTEYTYEHFNGTGGSTIRSYEYYRVLERKDTDGTNDYNVETYTYYGDYTSWAKEHETSKVSVTNEDGLTVERGFKKYLIGGNALQFYRLKEYERSYYKDGENEINVSRTDYGKYFERSYPLSITKRVFSEDGTRSIDTTENYEYDEYGNRIKYWDPRANGDTNDTEHLTTYAYDSEYHYLTESAYKRDADTTIREVNTPSEDHKNIIEQSTYMNGALAAKSSFSYDENSGKPKSTTIYRSTASGDSVTTSCEYQDNTFKTKETTNGNTTEYTYDVFGRVLSQKDPKGNITAFAYDKLGRQTHVSYPDQTSTSAVYQLKDISGNVINRVTTTAQNGSQTEYNYDLFGREAIIKDLTLNVTQEIHEYDSMGRIKKVTASTGAYITYDYDVKGRTIAEKTYESNGTLTLEKSYVYENAYDAETSKTMTVVGTGGSAVKTAQYADKYGNVVREDPGDTGLLSESKRYTYDYQNNQTSEIFRTTETGADEIRTIVTVLPAANQGTQSIVKNYYNQESKVYSNMAGQEKDVVDGNGNHILYAYDASGRLASRSVNMGAGVSITQYTYDANGNVTKESITDNKPGEPASTRNTYKEYDPMNRVIRVWGEEEGETQYTYDSLGNILTMTVGITEEEPQGQTTCYEYDARGRLIKTTDAMGQTETRSYDTQNNLTGMTDRNGAVTVNTYDGNSQILTNQISLADESDTVSYQYSTGGLIQSMSNTESTVNYTYNAKGQTVSETMSGVSASVKNYTYDADGNMSRIQINNGSAVYDQGYTYNPIGQLVKVTDNLRNAELASYTYDNAGNISKETLGNGVETTYLYNSANALSAVTNKLGSTVLSSYSYSYYLDGNQSQITDHTGRSQSFDYDKLGRLVQEADAKAGTSKTTQYTYDRFSNRSSMTVTGSEQTYTSYTYDGNNRLTQTSKTIGTEEEICDYSYDSNGNLIAKSKGTYSPANGGAEELELSVFDQGSQTADTGIENANTVLYSYNLRNQLTGISADNGLNAGYAYDVTGRRVGKTVNGSSTSYLWGGDHIAYETGEHTVSYSYGVRRIGISEGADQRYCLYNGHGDTVQLANGNGTIAEDYRYDAFGNQQEETEHTVYNPFRYSGEYMDEESGLTYLRNRYYDSAIGRFITEDPIRDGLNWYVYCNNNPVNFADPSGLVAGKRDDQNINKMGTMVSSGAAAYADYYYDQALALTDEYIAAGKPFDAEYTRRSNEINAKIDDIIKLDDEGKVAGQILEVPVYNQYDTFPHDYRNELCWATCQAMMSSYYLGDTIDRTQSVASYTRAFIEYFWGSPISYNESFHWISSDKLYLGLTQSQIQVLGNLSMPQIRSTIESGDPFGVLYRNFMSGHWVLGIGYATAPGHDPLVVSNDPGGGIQRIQTYDDFQTLPDGRIWTETAISVN